MSGTVRKAACAMLLRQDKGGTFEVFLVERAKQLEFLGGYHVFPGGTAEPTDNDLRDTAARELFEETGVLVARGADSLDSETIDSMRRDVLEKGARWPELLKQHNLVVNADAFVPLGTWKTPPYTTYTFHAEYYVVNLPEGAAPSIWEGELASGAWRSPNKAMADHRQGDIALSFPVLETLRIVEEHGTDFSAASLALEERTSDTEFISGGEMLHGLDMVPVRTFTLPPATHTNCYVLGLQDAVVVDPATPIEEEQERLVRYLRKREQGGATLKEVWLTHHHKDHIGAVNLIRDTFNIPVAAHVKTAESLEGEIAVDRLIEDGDVTVLRCEPGIEARWRALYTPGHAKGHLCFYEENLGTIISGDNVLGMGTVLISPPEGNMLDYLDSLKRMADRPLGFLFPAHGPPVAASRERIEFYIAHRLQREASILEALETSGSAADIVPRVYTDVDPRVFPLAEINVRAHLEKLVTEGKVHESGDVYSRVDS